MATAHKTLSFSTKEKVELVDITKHVEAFVAEQGARNGLCLVYAPHATAAVIANENEPGLIRDTVRKIKEEFPEDAKWEHNRIDDNAQAHLASSFMGPSKTFAIVDGVLVRGTWQNIFFVELDGPRKNRSAIIQITGEK